MGNDYSAFITPNPNPDAAIGALTTDLGYNSITSNKYRQAAADLQGYDRVQIDRLVGAPIAISGISTTPSNLISTVAAHGLVANDPVRMQALGSGVMPTGLTPGLVYYWLANSATTGKLALTPGGSAVNITTAGTGPLYLFKLVDAGAGLYVVSGGEAAPINDAVVLKTGTQTITGAKTFDSITASGTSRYGLASRGKSRLGPEISLSGDDLGAITAGGIRDMPIEPPDESVLTSVSVWLTTEVHAALPQNMPSVSLVTVDDEGVQDVVATQGDASANFTAYNIDHRLELAGLSVTVDRSAFTYRIRFTAESGTASDSSAVSAPKFSFTTSSQDDGAG